MHTANGAGMRIDHIGHSILHSPIRDVHLKNILHVPSANKSLLSVHRLVKDNNAFLELHPNHFSLKEQETKKTLLEGQCEGGLYPVKPQKSTPSTPSNKQVLGAFKPSTSCGMVDLVMPPLRSSREFLVEISCLFQVVQIKVWFVMRVRWARLISYPILSQTVFLPNLLSLCLVMCGGRLLLLLAGTPIM